MFMSIDPDFHLTYIEKQTILKTLKASLGLEAGYKKLTYHKKTLNVHGIVGHVDRSLKNGQITIMGSASSV